MPSYTINVNGEDRSVDVSPETPMLWVLRDELSLVGTKFGCGVGACGACTIHVDGTAMRGCQTTVESVSKNNNKITTIEGLGKDGMHPVQQAWMEHDVPQCGYCQAGQMMSAASLLSSSPDPSDAEINAGMSGNICRCGTYLRIHEAVKTAAKLNAAT